MRFSRSISARHELPVVLALLLPLLLPGSLDTGEQQRPPNAAVAALRGTIIASLQHPALPPDRELWLPPLAGPLRISSHYDLPHGPYRAGHRGIDLPAEPGLTVRSPTAGTVSFIGTVVDRPLISILVDDRTLLSLEPVSSELREGDVVARGQPIGVVAEGGHCASSCLHLGVRVNGEYVNPLRFLRERATLLPW